MEKTYMSLKQIMERGKLIMERRDALKDEHPDWHELKLRVEAAKQLDEEALADPE